MTNWHFKQLDEIATIGQRLAKDESVADHHRDLFSQAYALAESLKHARKETHHNAIANVFDLLCKGCKEARLTGCNEEKGTFRACHLVREQSA